MTREGTAAAPTYRARHPVAYLTYPGADAAHGLGRLPGPLGWLPQHALGHLPLRPSVTATLRSEDNPERPAGWVITLPLTESDLRAGSARVTQTILRAVGRAQALGARTVGLGGRMAQATAYGRALCGMEDVGVTTGGAYTAALTFMLIQRVLRHCAAQTRIAVVGAGTAIGQGVATLLARHTAHPLLLVDPHERPPRELQATVATGRAQTTAELLHVHTCGLVVVLDPAASGLRAAHLGPDATVLDAASPRVFWPQLLLDRPDIRIVDAPQAGVPGIRHPGRDTTLPTCLAETLLLGLSGHEGHFALGDPTPGQAQTMLDLAARFSRLGFAPAAPQSFGTPVTLNRRFEQDTPAGADRREQTRRGTGTWPALPLASTTP
ncbi:semialdehyde dehydrogenase [uncultured Deinococcus sp.]|uniref:semialdehyde dehydrogenase n=1 Tax=uncultured Deinococcus sp. TaxID=158789 RepID=UPI0025F0CE5F|nr:semialdehyde dehydrogenase [uncultured Deinococcus sp.]